MDKILLKDLKRDTFRRSALLCIPDINNLFSLNDDYTPQEIFFGIVKDALKVYEKWLPIYLQTKVYIEPDNMNGTFQFKDNFSGYINGSVPEDMICLIPSAITSLSKGGWNDSCNSIQYRYYPPRLSEFWYYPSTYFMSYLANRPIVESYDEKSKDFTDDCAVYFMTKDTSSESRIFLDQVYVELCRYIINLKKNFALNNLPIDMFGGLEDDYNRVFNELNDYYRSSFTDGQYLN